MKCLEVSHALKNAFSNEKKVLEQLFIDFPKLEKIALYKTSEYNDNDYSDYFRIVEINGLSISDGEYNIDDDEKYENYSYEEWKKEMIQEGHYIFDEHEINHICRVTSILEDFYDVSEDVYTITRKRLNILVVHKDPVFEKYWNAVRDNKKIEDLSIFNKSPNWALYYCMDMKESLPLKKVESIFKKDVKYAYYYAVCVLKGRLPENLEKHFDNIEKKLLIDTFDNEKRYLSWTETEQKYYIKKYKDFVSK